MAIVRFKSIIAGKGTPSARFGKTRRNPVKFKSSPKNKGTKKDERKKDRAIADEVRRRRNVSAFKRELKKIGPAKYRP